MDKKQNYINHGEITLLKSMANFKKDLSNKTIKNYIKNGMVKVNDKVITNSSYLLHENDNIEIIYIKNKKNDHKYIFVVHRLDQDTSGILLFCKDEKIRDKMQDNWNTIVKKRGYVAVVDGKMTGSGTIHTYLKENRGQFVYSSKNNDGKEAITHYSIIKNNNSYSLVQVFIDTGRRNQIRVHLSEKGYPIAGDKKYKCKTNPIKRLCLHANILEFIHPVTKKLIHIESEIPTEIKKLVK